MQGAGQWVSRTLVANLMTAQGNAFSHQANALFTISWMVWRQGDNEWLGSRRTKGTGSADGS
ncbi:hypothetical protein AU512_01760 [Lonsdalea iberica]|uniref:Uncharacterized protein n=1 Tax=Lonsdalea iberica TaxID=1082703 RepID=A0ABX3XJL7_9GAMM|nr:hypothetical protein AU512_01760 [Lonsdalea iberica]